MKTLIARTLTISACICAFCSNTAQAQFQAIPTNMPPQAAQAWRNARNQATKENYKAALQYMDECIKLCPNAFQAYLDRAALKSSLGEYEAAKKDWEYVALNCQNNKLIKAVSHCSLAGYYSGKGDLINGLKNYDMAVSLNPKYTTARKMRAQVLISANQISKALADYDYLIKTASGGNTETYRFERARVCERAGLFKEAKQDYDQILLVEKDQDEALYKRSICLSKLGQIDLALKDINDAIKYSGDNSRYLETRAQIYDKLGKSSLAKQDRAKAKSINGFFE